MPYLTLQGGAEFSNFSNLQTDFIIKAKLGSRFYLLQKNKVGLFIDTNFFMKTNITDTSKNDFSTNEMAINLSAGIAF